MRLHCSVLLLLAIFSSLSVHAQDSLKSGLQTVSYIQSVSSKSERLARKLEKKSAKALAHFQKEESGINKKLARKDSAAAKKIFGDAKQQYDQLQQRLQQAGSPHEYIPALDTIRSSLAFLQQSPSFIFQSGSAQKKLVTAVSKANQLGREFQKSESIKKFLKERRQYLQTQLQQTGLAKELKRMNKQVYYYSEQLNEYKILLKDHKKAEKKAIELLSKTKIFKDFMRKHSQLAFLFRLPQDAGDLSLQASLAGLQTRTQVNNLIQQQLAAGGAAAQEQFRKNLQQAQDQIKQLKNKIIQSGRGSSDAELPEGFKPNNQRTKSFLQRLELGTNVQSQKARGFFPTTNDIGLSLGYKLNDKSIIGIGGSYKIGWGRDIRHINITHQGIGLRSFVDWKIRGSFWLSGGYEMNYRSEFRHVTELKNLNAWQQSGLIGISKVISLQTKFFKNTKLELLWDFLSYRQVPQTQAIVFRIGYQIN